MTSLTRQEEQVLLIIHHLRNSAYLVNIRETIKQMTGKYLDVGTIYVPLKRLHAKGLLAVFHGEPTAVRGGKAIKFYRLTPLGYAALAETKMIQDRLWKGVMLPDPEG